MKKTRKIKEKKLKTVSKTKGKLSLFSVLIMLALVPLVPSVIILGMVSLTITKSNMEASARKHFMWLPTTCPITVKKTVLMPLT